MIYEADLNQIWSECTKPTLMHILSVWLRYLKKTKNFFILKLYFQCIVPMAAMRYSKPILTIFGQDV